MKKLFLTLFLLFTMFTITFADEQRPGVDCETIIYHLKANGKLQWQAVAGADGYELKAVRVFAKEEKEIDLTGFVIGTYCPVRATLEVLEPRFYYDLWLRAYKIIGGIKHYGEWIKSSDKEYAVLNNSSGVSVSRAWRIHYYKPQKGIGALILLLLS